jgi:hypothetical protein
MVKGREGRQADEEEKRIFHQGPKASRCLHDEAGYMTASVLFHVSVRPLLDIVGGSIYDNASSPSRSAGNGSGVYAAGKPFLIF